MQTPTTLICSRAYVALETNQHWIPSSRADHHLDMTKILYRNKVHSWVMTDRKPCSISTGTPGLYFVKHGWLPVRPRGVAGGDNISGQVSDEDDELCPVDCVKEFKTDEDFFRILEKAKHTDSLVVVDFYRTSCGSCKYIEQGFAKLCKGAGDEEADVIFLKHNVIDEYDEQSEVAERLRIRTVPLFHFYKGGVLLEAFPTRDKEKITAAIQKYTSPPRGSPT